jgi:integrase
MSSGVRKLRDGTEVAVNTNEGIRKICGCTRVKKRDCKHPWYFNYQWKGTSYRFHLNRHLGRKRGNLAKSEADRVAEEIRIAIRKGSWNAAETETADESRSTGTTQAALTFEEFAEYWKRLKGCQLVRPEDNNSRIRTIRAFMLLTGERFGALPMNQITADHIEQFRAARKTAGLSVVTHNHDLKLMRKMWNWGIRARREAERNGQQVPPYGLTSTPFRDGGVALISLEKETPRSKRFSSEQDEDRLLALADVRMRAFITTMLDTCCRPGELRSLQWREVDLKEKELTILAGKSKTGVGGEVPLSARVVSLLEMRQYQPDGKLMPEDAYVFGNEIGQAMTKDVLRNAWESLRTPKGRARCQRADRRHHPPLA